ncbi:PREDICTED: major royal jelly protein 1 [Rhagoletis zephyria]|uniref:major royal jelly protein 1 n=1 Tax=Rhagoletis zephyria TaxID=28612 RepID=UPI0008117A9D|nr:PREDICTED: major royal jelly protein 1 [Rhagoletis zephyria]
MWKHYLLIAACSFAYWTTACAAKHNSYGSAASTEVVSAPPSVPTIQWTGGQFEFPGSSRSLFKSSGKYISKNVIATRAQIVGDTVFLALPRYKHGVPATLAKTTLKSGACQTTLAPFPCWDMQDDSTCKGFQSVVDLVVDQNEVLWVLDTGIVNTLETPERKCAPKVVALSVKTGKVLKSVSLEGLTSPNSRLQYIVVDYAPDGSCFIYVSDAANRAIIVYNLQADRGFRVVLPKVVANGCRARDVLYIALIRKDCGTTELFFTYLSTNKLFSLQSEYLRSGAADGRIMDLGKKPSRMVIIGTDNGSAIFFRNEGDSEVYRWDTSTAFVESNFKPVYRSDTCQLATHAVPDYNRNTMRVLQSNFPDYMQNRVGCGAIQQLSVMQGCW